MTDKLETRDEKLRETANICRSFLGGLVFIAKDTGRDPRFFENHLLSYAAQDFLQSVTAIRLLVREGIQNACLRELRFVLETSVKLCFVQQKKSGLPISDKLVFFERTLNSPSISIKKELELNLLPEIERPKFEEEVGRLYGTASKYVHFTVEQLAERINFVDSGRTSGNESAEDVDSLNRLLARSLACSLVLILHAVPNYVAGDLLVGGLDDTWYFRKSKYIALLDSTFDYKAERQERLQSIQEERDKAVLF
jgi:hypothetical protein